MIQSRERECRWMAHEATRFGGILKVTFPEVEPDAIQCEHDREAFSTGGEFVKKRCCLSWSCHVTPHLSLQIISVRLEFNAFDRGFECCVFKSLLGGHLM